MLGTTRTRVKYFMGKFRKLGFIKYNGGLQINASPWSVVLHDETPTALREVYLALGRYVRFKRGVSVHSLGRFFDRRL